VANYGVASNDYKKKFIFYHTVKDWNCLPNETVHKSIPKHFRNYILPQTIFEVLHQLW